MSIVFAVPAQVAASPLKELWPGVEMTWEAFDPVLGEMTVWDIGKGREGVTLMPGVKGMGRPDERFYEDTAPGVAGSRHRRAVANPREVFWPVRVRNVRGTHHGSVGFIELDAAWWRTLDTNRTGVWKVIQPNGTYRSLTLRLVDDGGYAADRDPSLLGREVYGVTLRANQPFWEGQPVIESWKPKDPVPVFVAPNDPDPGVVRLSSSFTLDNATMTNPGEKDAYPTWTIMGPTTSVQVGVAGKTISIPFSIPAWSVAVVDTRQKTCFVYELTAEGVAKRPDDWVIGVDLINGVEGTRDLGAASFAPIPAGTDRELSLAMSGSGLVMAKIVPLYNRAR